MGQEKVCLLGCVFMHHDELTLNRIYDDKLIKLRESPSELNSQLVLEIC